MKGLTLGGIGMRFLFALALVLLTWNPSSVNFFHWAFNHWSDLRPVVFFVGLALLGGWIIYLRATARSLGTVGIILALAIAGAILWLTIFYGLIDPTNSVVLTWVILTLVAAVLTVGMSWSHLRRRWSGQADVDDVDDRDN